MVKLFNFKNHDMSCPEPWYVKWHFMSEPWYIFSIFSIFKNICIMVRKWKLGTKIETMIWMIWNHDMDGYGTMICKIHFRVRSPFSISWFRVYISWFFFEPWKARRYPFFRLARVILTGRTIIIILEALTIIIIIDRFFRPKNNFDW